MNSSRGDFVNSDPDIHEQEAEEDDITKQTIQQNDNLLYMTAFVRVEWNISEQRSTLSLW